MLIFLGIIIFALGVLVGFLMCMALYVFEYVMEWAKPTIIKGEPGMPRKILERKIREMYPRRHSPGSIIMPLTEQEIGAKMIIEENRKSGRETKLSEL